MVAEVIRCNKCRLAILVFWWTSCRVTARSPFSSLCCKPFSNSLGLFSRYRFLCFELLFFNDSCAVFFFLFSLFWAGRQDYYSWCFSAFHLSQLFFSTVFWTFRVLHSSILGKVFQIVIGQYSQWRGESVQLFIFLWSCQLEVKKRNESKAA